MAQVADTVAVHLKEDTALRGWDAAASQDLEVTAADLAHAIRFGRAQEALEQLMTSGDGLTADHARALHFANEMAELRHYAPLISVHDGAPALAPGVAAVIMTFDELGLWVGQPAWRR